VTQEEKDPHQAHVERQGPAKQAFGDPPEGKRTAAFPTGKHLKDCADHDDQLVNGDETPHSDLPLSRFCQAG
jgi:hypothetical protein